MAYYGGFWGIRSGLTKSTDHPSLFTYIRPQRNLRVRAEVWLREEPLASDSERKLVPNEARTTVGV